MTVSEFSSTRSSERSKARGLGAAGRSTARDRRRRRSTTLLTRHAVPSTAWRTAQIGPLEKATTPRHTATSPPLGRRPVERLDGARLTERVRAPQPRRATAPDRARQVLELARYGSAASTASASAAPSGGAARSPGPPVPRVVDEQRPVRPDHLELVAARHVEAAVERAEHAAAEAQRAGEAHVDAVAAVDRSAARPRSGSPRSSRSALTQ